MCRLFGFRSVLGSQVHQSLVNADNAFLNQSVKHPDGWGISYYIDGAPHVIRSLASAIDDQLFRKVSGIVASQTVIAHLRKATAGKINVTNTHPFQYGHWTFAHNGNIRGFSKYRDTLSQEIDKDLRRFVLGDTDSEVLFFLLMSRLRLGGHFSANPNHIVKAIAWLCDFVTERTGSLCQDDEGSPEESYLSFLLTNGRTMAVFQGGKKLYFSSYKKFCADATDCSFYNPSCVNPSSDGKVNHAIFSSEPLAGENVWEEMKFSELVVIDDYMTVHRSCVV